MSYRTALIGLSGIGARHQRGYAATDGVELVAIADIDEDLVAQRGTRGGSRGGGGIAVTDSDTHASVDATTSREITAGQWLLVGDEGKLEFSEYSDEIRYSRLEESDDGTYGTEHRPASLPDPVDGFDSTDQMFATGAANVRGMLEGTEENRSPGGVATHVLEVIVALFVSHYTDSAIDLPLADPLRDVTITSR